MTASIYNIWEIFQITNHSFSMILLKKKGSFSMSYGHLMGSSLSVSDIWSHAEFLLHKTLCAIMTLYLTYFFPFFNYIIIRI